MADREAEKRDAARAAAELVGDGQLVGLGTGTTVAYLLPALAERRLAIRCVATSPATERAARALGLDVGPFEAIERLDVAIDGADQVDPRGWLVKGGGGWRGWSSAWTQSAAATSGGAGRCLGIG